MKSDIQVSFCQKPREEYLLEKIATNRWKKETKPKPNEVITKNTLRFRWKKILRVKDTPNKH